MIKKVLPAIIFCLFFVQKSFAIDARGVNLEFFNRFNDENLNFYVEQALKNNPDLKKSGHVVEQYRWQVKYSFGRELPSLSVSANYLGLKTPELNNFTLKENAFVLPFLVSYEADFLLKNRDKAKALKKSYEAAQFTQKAVYIALLTDVATVYTNILYFDDLIEKYSQVLKNQEEILSGAQKKFKRGLVALPELNSIKEELHGTKSTLEKLNKDRKSALMQLAVLIGESSSNISDMKVSSLDNFEYSGEIPNEIDSQVIFSRPDVKAAEAELEKANIDIRVARKEFFPSFNIMGVWAFNTLTPGTFFSWGSSLAAILAGAAQDIFKGGMKVANLKIKKAKFEELFEEYGKINLEALKEVNTSLCIIKHDTNIENNTKNVLNLESENFNAAENKMSRGIISKPQYLSDKNKLVKAQIDYTQAKVQRIINYFTLYKAVGGQL